MNFRVNVDLLISEELSGMIQIKRDVAIVGCGKYSSSRISPFAIA